LFEQLPVFDCQSDGQRVHVELRSVDHFPPELDWPAGVGGAAGVRPGFAGGGDVGTATGTSWNDGMAGLGAACPCFCAWIRSSIGTVSDGGCTGTGPVTAMGGVRISMLLLGSMNLV